MAEIHLKEMHHSYIPNPKDERDWALKSLDLKFRDGGAYALLGPSGCGKTTMLNIISGLVHPSHGQVLFDGQDMTSLAPDERAIAQVFQFPVIYDTMTVFDNLAFPLRNRGIDEGRVKSRVGEIAEMLELTDMLETRAKGLGPDSKQKISMGRGLVREDVNVIMFDEPLTVIDPHLKWKLRSKLKELHQAVGLTMIYVTHDQTEALTFADEVVVMDLGEVVQIGTPVDLFERPAHTFVGHFIGSPGMNVLPCETRDGQAFFEGTAIPLSSGPVGEIDTSQRIEIGVRPEFVRFASGDETGIPVDVIRVADAGRRRVVETRSKESRVYLSLDDGEDIPTGTARIAFDPARTWLYADGRIKGVTTDQPVTGG